MNYIILALIVVAISIYQIKKNTLTGSRAYKRFAIIATVALFAAAVISTAHSENVLFGNIGDYDASDSTGLGLLLHLFTAPTIAFWGLLLALLTFLGHGIYIALVWIVYAILRVLENKRKI